MRRVLFKGFDQCLLVLPGQPEYRHRAHTPDDVLARQQVAALSADLINLRTMRAFLDETFRRDVRQMTDDQVVETMASLLAAGRYQLVAVERRRPDLTADVRPRPPERKPAPASQEGAWIEVLLVDEQDAPVPGVRYEIRRADGSRLAAGTLDGQGPARVTGIPGGKYRVGFPELDEEFWVQAS
jgi:hypothetical protein